MDRDRQRLSRIGDVCAVVGAALLGIVPPGLSSTLPPTYGVTLLLWAAGAMGAILVATGFAYVWAARKALDPAAAENGLGLTRDPVTGEAQWIPWQHIAKVRLSSWKMSPWLRNPRFYDVEVTTQEYGAPSAKVFLVYLRDARGFTARLRDAIGNRLELAPDAHL